MKNLNKLSSWVLYSLLAVAVLVFVLFACGSSEEVMYNGESYDAPNNTDLLLYIVYIYIGIATVVAIVTGFTTFLTKFSSDKRSFWTSLSMTIALLVLSGITYACGDDTPLTLIGYEGSENVGGYLKLADMCLYSIYTLLIVACVAAVLNSFAKKI